MKKMIFKIFFVSLFVFYSNSSIAQTAKEKTKKVNKTEVAKQTPFLVDVRTPGEFAQGSVKGAVNIPLDQVQNSIAKFKNKKDIIIFCRSGSRSAAAISILQKNGITNLTNGGSWQNVNEKLKK
jgi:rhodanese-related sulfurtransferase